VGFPVFAFSFLLAVSLPRFWIIILGRTVKRREKTLRFQSVGLLTLLFLFCATIALGCEQKEEIPSIALEDLSSYVGKKVLVTGCLLFSCPTIPGATYPEDCKVFLKDGDTAVALEFPPEKENLREVLNVYYEEHFTRCVRLKVQGMVREKPCEVAECVPTLYIEVEEILIQREGENMESPWLPPESELSLSG
jgi:hypothetical protein